MKIGLFFGTFDPIHIGHVQIGLSLFKAYPVDQVWFVVTPISPFKMNQHLSSKEDRFNMVSIALEEYNNLMPSALEFELESPNYTCDTLRYIKSKYPNYQFTILMGGDNYLNIDKWKDYQYILDNFQLCVYDRIGRGVSTDKSILHIEGKYLNVSSSQIRNNFASSSTDRFLNRKVLEYIQRQSLYQK